MVLALRYQWQRDGVNIPGATGPRYITPVLEADDSGARLQCVVVSNPQGSVTSRVARLVVRPRR